MSTRSRAFVPWLAGVALATLAVGCDGCTKAGQLRVDGDFPYVRCLAVDERHLVWMRASKERWRTVATRLGVCIKTAQRRHEKALAQVATMLNHSNTPTVTTVSSSRHTGLRPSIFER